MKFKSIPFTKYNGTGNDFIIIDNRENLLEENEISNFTISACRNKTGIGADGILIFEKSNKADFKMRIINADASEAEMCGNGARCIVHFAYLINCTSKNMVFETIAGDISGEVKDNNIVKVKLTDPFDFKKNISIKYKDQNLDLFFINTGVPHTILFVDDVKDVDVFNTGRFIRNHEIFKPAGTNVNFVQVLSDNEVSIRTYERGVEDETLACGTGITASSIMSSLIKNTSSPVCTKTKNNDILNVFFKIEDDVIKDVFLEGEVQPVFSGITEFDGSKIFVE